MYIKLNSDEFLLSIQTKEAFNEIFSHYEFWNINHKIMLFWQPLESIFWDRFHDRDESGRTLDNLVDDLLEHKDIFIDSHSYVPYNKPFDEYVKYYLK